MTRSLASRLLVWTTLAALGGCLDGRAAEHRDARLAALRGELPALVQADALDGAGACAVLEAELLERGDALAVDCGAARVEAVGEGALRLSGAVRASTPFEALFGGGFATPYCLGRGPEGWRVLGTASTLDDCRAGSAQEAAARHRAVALDTLARIRAALAGPRAALPEVCADLGPAGPAEIGLLDADALAGRYDDLAGWPVQGGLAQACDPDHAVVLDASLPDPCRLGAPWRYALVLEGARRDELRVHSDLTYTGGHFEADLVLVDVAQRRVRCERRHVADAGEVLLNGSEAHAWQRAQQRAMCASVAALTAGRVSLDGWWGC